VLSSQSITTHHPEPSDRAPWGGRWIGRQQSSTVWSSAPHSQTAEEVIPYLCKQERKRLAPVRGRLGWTHAVLGRTIPGGWDGDGSTESRSALQLSAFNRWSAQGVALLLLSSDKLMSCCAVRTNGCLDLRRRASALHAQASAEWDRCPDSMAWRARDSTCALQRSSVGWMPARNQKIVRWCRTQAPSHHSQGVVGGRLNEAGVSTAAPDRSVVQQYFAVEWTRAKVALRNVVAPAPQPEPANRLKSAKRDVNVLRSDSRCRWYVIALSNVTPRYVGSEQKGRVSLLWLTFSSRLVSLLLRWKTANTAFVVVSYKSGGIHPRLPYPCLESLPLFVSFHQHAWLVDW